MVAPARPGPGTAARAATDLVEPTSGSGRPLRRLVSGWPALAFGLVVVLLWAWAASSRPAEVLPSPAAVGGEVWRLTLNGDLLRMIGRSMAVMGVGFGGSAVVGVALGLLLSSRPYADRAVSPYLIGLQSLPSAVWIPVAIIFLGATQEAVLAVTVLGALPSITIGTRDAVFGVPPLMIRAARTYGARGVHLMTRVVVPAALPGIISGLEHGWAFAFRSLVAGELITGAKDGGIGIFVNGARQEGRVDQLLAGVLMIMTVGLLVDRFGFARAQRRMRRRRGLEPAGAA